MKKLSIILVVLMIGLLFVGCGGTEPVNYDDYTGTWECKSLILEGEDYSDTLVEGSMVYLQLAKDKTGMIEDSGEAYNLTWEVVDSTVVITQADATYSCPFDGTTLTLTAEENNIYVFEKIF